MLVALAILAVTKVTMVRVSQLHLDLDTSGQSQLIFDVCFHT
jgi:hypothetical protein